MLSDQLPEAKNVFVDRTIELAKLHTALKMASSGKGRLILVEGEAGIGKTSLINRFLKDVENSKIRRSECIYGENEPYAPIKRIMEEQEIESIKKDIPLLGIMPIPAPSKKKDVEELGGEREKMFESFIGFIKKRAGKEKSVYVIENIQWLDDASAKLIEKVLPTIGKTKILFIMTYRPGEISRNGPAKDLISKAKILEIASTIKLERLEQPDVEEMVKGLLNRDDVPKSFIKEVYKETEGNPLFIKELLNSLIQEGIIDPTSYLSIEAKKIRVPPSVKEIMLRRIAKLSPEARKVLSYAAVIGVRFDFETLRNLTGMEEDPLLDALDELLSAGIIEEDKDTEEEIYIFTYVQMKEVVESSLNKSRRRVMHKRIAEFMEKHGKDPYSMAEHFLKGGVYEKAYKYAVEAAEKSIESLGFEAAVKYYEMAADAFEKMGGEKDERELLKILINIGNLHKTLGNWDEAKSYYLRALHLADKLNDEEASIEINFGMGDMERNKGNWEKAEMYFEAAKNIAERRKDKHKLGEAERSLGYLHWRKGEYAEAVEHFTKAIKYAKESNDSGMAGKIFIEMGNVYSDMGNIEKAIEYYKKSIPRLKKMKNYREIGRALNNLGDSYLQLENWKSATEYFARAEDAAAKAGDINMIAWAMFNAAEAYARNGEVEKAKKFCDEAYEVLEKMGDRVAIAAIHRVYGIIAMEEGKWDDAKKHLKKSVEILKELKTPYLLALSLFELGNVYAHKGKIDKARKYYEEAMKIFEGIKSKNNIEKVKKALENLESSES